MATRRTSSVKVHRDSGGFTTVLASAVLEWLLIFLLFIDAVFSYLVTKFSRYSKLQTPCLLCSRLDHVLGEEKPGFYRNLICGGHKLEISSLVLCHSHDKLADVHGMCECCLFSFATENKTNSETYRLLVGKLGTDLKFCVDQDPLLEDPKLESLNRRHCSCCNEPWQSRSYAQRFLQTKSIEPEVAELDTPLPGFVGHSPLHRRDVLKKRTDKLSGSLTSLFETSGFDPLSHIGYSELKITSDSESEVPFSDDDGGNALVREKDALKEDFTVQCVPLEPCAISPDILPKDALFDDLAAEKLINQASIPEPSLLVPHVQPTVSEPHDETFLASAVATGHGLEELNWHHVEQKANPSALGELISLNDIPPSSNVAEALVEVSREILDVKGTGDSGNESIIESGEVCKLENMPTTTAGAGLKIDEVLNEGGLLMPSYMDLSDAYKMAVGNKGRQVSGMLGEQLTGKDSTRVNEDMKLLLSQLSAARGIELSLNDMSPRDELKITDASSSTGLQILQKRILLERNESGFESLDGSIISEIEGESVVDRLKRQVESDRKSMSALYKELEEERSASAVATNQAMAMITRLQEEKAALHMEALQYLRMMEEQAEYDVEALQKANDLLVEREKEIQDLEAELECYRNKFPNESMVENKPELIYDVKGGDMKVEHSDSSGIKSNSNVPCNLLLTKKSEGSNKPEVTDMMCEDKNVSIVKNSLLEFDNERSYISQCLKKLEYKLNLFSNNGVYADMSNGGYSGREADEVNDLEELHRTKETQENSQMEEEGLAMRKDPSVSRGCPPAQERCIPSVGDPQFVSKENHFDCNGKDSYMAGRETGLIALGNEVSDLNDRLEALEADRNFLKHTINSLQNGDEGLQFVQEIADHLRELRSIGIRRRDQAVA